MRESISEVRKKNGFFFFRLLRRPRRFIDKHTDKTPLYTRRFVFKNALFRTLQSLLNCARSARRTHAQKTKKTPTLSTVRGKNGAQSPPRSFCATVILLFSSRFSLSPPYLHTGARTPPAYGKRGVHRVCHL